MPRRRFDTKLNDTYIESFLISRFTTVPYTASLYSYTSKW